MRGQLSIQHVIVEKGGEGEEGEGEGRRDLRVEERGDDRVEAEGVLELEGPDGFGGGVGSRGRSSEKSDKRNNESDTKHIRDDRDRCQVLTPEVQQPVTSGPHCHHWTLDHWTSGGRRARLSVFIFRTS